MKFTLYLKKAGLASRNIVHLGKVRTGPMDLRTIGLFFELFFGPFFRLFSKSDFYQKVIFGVGMLFIYGAEERGNGKMKMASRQ